jgi:hypothetical protein
VKPEAGNGGVSVSGELPELVKDCPLPGQQRSGSGRKQGRKAQSCSKKKNDDVV